MLKLEYKSETLQFTFDAGTSRGVMRERKVWFLKIYEESEEGIVGIGEVAPLPRLSYEDLSLVPVKLEEISHRMAKYHLPASNPELSTLLDELEVTAFPSISFGLEMALIDLMNGGKKVLFEGPFSRGEESININGLIWMGDKALMKDRIDQKLAEGFSCIKMKIGAIDFDEEIRLLQYLRSRSEDLIIRVDANGAFNVREVLGKLKQLSEAHLNLHSIEQPILPNQMEAMQLVCRRQPIPVALDEELIGKHSAEEKVQLLEDLKPQYIVLKPSLLGGFGATRHWIRLAQERGIGWWITSALESNIGLSAICQFTALYDNDLHQGLGTGQLYHNNIDSPLQVQDGTIRARSQASWGSPF